MIDLDESWSVVKDCVGHDSFVDLQNNRGATVICHDFFIPHIDMILVQRIGMHLIALHHSQTYFVENRLRVPL